MAGSGSRSVRTAWVRSTPVLLAATLLTGGGVAAVLLGQPRVAGALVLAAGAAILWGWYLADRERLARSRFLAMLIDPLHDVSLLAAVAWAARAGAPREAAAALVALGLCYLASYERARADALGFRTFESVGYRAARSALIAIGLLSGRVAPALWVLSVLAAGAVAVRALNVAVQHRGPRAARRRAAAS
jgi:hypothetical protein